MRKFRRFEIQDWLLTCDEQNLFCLFLLGIVESPHMEGEANAVGYLKDHYKACKNTCKW